MWPPNKILFPIDFSERSVSAARYVRTLGCRFRPEITLMHVLPAPAYGVGSLESGPLMVEEAWEEQQRRAQEDVAEFATRELSPFRVHPTVLEGDPATAIVEKAHSERADLIVMATHGYGPFRRFILGSVTAKVLHDADCPVWTGAHLPAVPAGEQASQQVPVKQIVCAVDLSSYSENVLDWAARLAKSFDARLFVIHAIPALAPAEEDYYQQGWREDLASGAKHQLDGLQQSVGTKAEQLVVAGDVPHAVCAQTEELDADVLVIGRSSESGLLGRLRTNAYAIIRGAHCPVVSV
jgi:nucleotide-binding universal stress UspA family protein